MLVFKMDTTNFFKYGQKHELRISLPKTNKTKSSNSNNSGSGGGLYRRSSLCVDTLTSLPHHHHHSHHHHHGSSSSSRRGSVSGGSVRHHRISPDRESTRILKNGYSRGTPEVIKEVRFALDDRDIKGKRGDSEGSLSEGSSTSRSSSSKGSNRSSRSSTSNSRSSSSNGGTTTTSSTSRRKKRNKESSSSNSSSSRSGTTNRRRGVEQPGGSEESAHGLVTIRMKPDEGGKFGFNVKGGADQSLPVLVSRVAPNTPADRCYPRLNEGDQVLLINGRDVSAMTHEQVVNFIRASRECHSGELVLTVKQNVYLVEEQEEPAFQYVPETSGVLSSGSAGGEVAPLHESMLLLGEGLEAGSLVAQFEQLYRRKPGLTVTEARRPENEKKNRYRDISPYDSTRVVLTQAPSGDYINASYVNMEVQGSGIVNRYIACQGPLAGTCADFWHMVWEQQSTLIVMLTTVVEQGRVKCHRYWPRHYETVDFGILQVTCLKEEETPGFAYREFTLINTETQEERHISHMQYLAWPDHGVPDDSTEFLKFVKRVRKARDGMVEPTIVHCSAGIGRTGVLILMETAQCLIEANEPVYPLDVVRAMRDQRAMMIQTASQFRFVCEAIQRVYTEGVVKPLAEYQQR